MSDYLYPKDKWIWMPHAAHFICGHQCRFKLATYVGGYIVSTVGELPDPRKPDSREYEDIGYQRKYETMVFQAAPQNPKYTCCPFSIINAGDGVDMAGYNDANAATAGHYALCEKWSRIEPGKEASE